MPVQTYRLAPLFVWDHWSRDLPEAEGAVSMRVHETKRQMVVELDAVGYDELMSDARYYAELGGEYQMRSLAHSAAAVVRALEKQGRPPEQAINARVLKNFRHNP